MKEWERNPFPMFGKWFYRNEDGQSVGPYETQIAALRALINYIDPPWWRVCLNLISQPFYVLAKLIGRRLGREYR